MSNLRAIGAGYIRVYVNEVEVSKHTTKRGAYERMYDEKLQRPDADVRCRQELEVVLEGNFEGGVIVGMQTEAGASMQAG